MSVLTEGQHAGEFIVSEANGHLSREALTVLSGQTLVAGDVMGRVKRAQAAAPIPAVVGTGNGVMTAVKLGPEGKSGSYVVTCTVAAAHGGTFSVVNPDGEALPDMVLTAGAGVTTDYGHPEIDFSITDGSTDFIVTDVFTVVVTAAGTPVVVGTGDGTMSAITLGQDANNGTYHVECITAVTNGGTFQVIAPNGERLDDLVLSAGAGNTTAFESSHVNFTIADASTDYVVGDYFNIAVAAGSNKIVAWNPTAVDGSHDVAGILFDAVDASAADAPGVGIVRNAEVNVTEIQYASTVTAAEKTLAVELLKALDISAL